jgi:hypothetical protein
MCAWILLIQVSYWVTAGAKVEAKACRATRNAMGGFVSYGLGAYLSVEDSYSLKVPHPYIHKFACEQVQVCTQIFIYSLR